MDKTSPQVFLNEAEEITYDRQKEEVGPNDFVRGSILPFSKDKEGVHLDWPQWAMDIYKSVTLPRDTLKGYQPTAKDTTNMALSIAGGGLGVSKVTKPAGDVGMFLGEKSYGADLTKLLTAKVMDQKSVDREEIWNKTGWWKKPDGKWAWEISDKNMQLNPALLDRIEKEPGRSLGGYSKNVVYHPEQKDLLPPDSYTFLEKIPETSTTDYRGSFDTGSGKIEASAKSFDQLKKTLLHEIQHAVQKKEDWSGGSNVSQGNNIVSQIRNKYLPKEWWEREEINNKSEQLVANREHYPEEEYNRLYDQYHKEYNEMSLKLKPLDDALDEFYHKFDVDLTDFSDVNTGWRMYRRNEGEAIAELTARRGDLDDRERSIIPPWMSMTENEETGLWVDPTDPEIYFAQTLLNNLTQKAE